MIDLLNWKEGLPDRIHVKVTPKASKERIKVERLDDGSQLVRVYVTAAPEGGKANEAVIALLAKYLGVSKSSLSIVRGLTNRDKIISINR